jgi:hypothetical protein
MHIEININNYSGPAELANAIREKIDQLYVDDVKVVCGNFKALVTLTTADAVCRGLHIASMMAQRAELQVALVEQDVAYIADMARKGQDSTQILKFIEQRGAQ